MFENVNDTYLFYINNKNDNNVNKIIYEKFEEYVIKNDKLLDSFNNMEGFGEIPFVWNWNLLVKDMPDNFKFLEIGVYKGRILSTIGLLANEYNKTCNIYGITPLNTTGDKFSVYNNSDFLSDINDNYLKYNSDLNNLHIINGLSQDQNVLNICKEHCPFDIIFIDGSHDYNDVVSDIQNYSNLLKLNGYLVMDDSSLYVPNAFGKFLGHPDVSKAANDCLDNNTDFIYLYSVGHNRVWKKIK